MQTGYEAKKFYEELSQTCETVNQEIKHKENILATAKSIFTQVD